MAMKRKTNSIYSNVVIRGTKEVDDDSKVHETLGTTSLADLSYDIVTNILIKLPIKSLLICKHVCKSWHSIISSDPDFARSHFDSAPITVLVRTRNYNRVSRTLHLLDFDEFISNESQNLSLLGDDDDDDDCGRHHACSCSDSPRPHCENHLKFEVKLKLPLRDSKMVIDTMLGARKNNKASKGTTHNNINVPSNPGDDKFDLVNSCNGLLCLCDYGRNPLVVCNPITGEFIRLPQSQNDKLVRHDFLCRVFSGFGYLKKTDEYKVLRMYGFRHGRHPSIRGYAVEVHTLGTGLWREVSYDGSYYWSGIRSPTCLNGSLHWIVFDDFEVSILCFDLESETFSSFPCPSTLSSANINKYNIGFGEIKGNLYVCYSCEDTKCLRFWTMKKHNDGVVGQCWGEVFSFNINNFVYWPYLYRPMMGSYASPDGILLYNDNPSKYFINYEPQKHLFRLLEARGKPLFKLEPIFHRPSLIRLKDAVKGDNIEVLNVHSRCGTFKLPEDDDVFYLAKYRVMLFDHHGEEFSFLRS